jgi:hypothetical protein
MLALSIRQPFAELILRGVKTIEYRSFATRILGQRFWIYASKGPGFRVHGSGNDLATKIWSDDLAVPGPKSGQPPAWMMELAELLILDKLPRGLIVGSAVIERCEPVRPPNQDAATPNPLYEWHLAHVERAKRLLKPNGHPQPVWFKPFG